MPHGVATEKVIEKGDMVTLDYGALYQGYVSDITRTVAVGEPDPQLKEIYCIGSAKKRSQRSESGNERESSGCFG